MNLVYDSSSSLGMNYVVNFVYYSADSPILGSFTQCSCVDVRCWTSSYMDVPFPVQPPAVMSTSRLPVVTLYL